jgi:hypothetical protein
MDESAFDINMRPSTARSARGTPAVIVTPSTKATGHAILGAISAMGVINIEIRVPRPPKKVKVVYLKKEEVIYVEPVAKTIMVVVPRECTALRNVESASKLVVRVNMLLDVVLQISNVNLFAKKTQHPQYKTHNLNNAFIFKKYYITY